MYFRNLLIGAAILAAPIQASIMSVPGDPLLPILETFATPNLGANVANVTNQFAGVVFTPGQTVVYDPNHAMGSGHACTEWGAPDPNCLTNFTENSDGSYNTITGTSLTFTLTNPATEVAFYLIWDMYPGTETLTQIAVNGGILTAGPQASFEQGQGGWFDINLNGTLISSVSISGIGANTSVSGGQGYGLVLSHIESDAAATPNPEPGTIMLLGAGLGAIGFFVRRRKA